MTMLLFVAAGNPYLQAALSTVPDYERLTALRAKVIARQASLHRPAEAPARPADADENLDEWLSAAVQASEAHRIWEVQRGALGSLRGEVEHCLEGLPQLHSDELLGSLAHDLALLMADCHGVVDQLHGASTAADAIANNAADAWRELSQLRRSYGLLREAQTSVMVAADPYYLQSARSAHIADDMASDCVLANLDYVLPGWRQPIPSAYVISGSPPDRRPWPAQPDEQIVWLCTSPAQPWVPTLRQLDALRERRHEQANRQAAPTTKPPKPKQRSKYPEIQHNITALNTEETADV